ncbi:hypothetical protein KY321_03835, partial [Candidatus Woesearchaeota archaeon]|nr:hypothetical protein [Candidatus Woesearchaeota archaeon]
MNNIHIDNQELLNEKISKIKADGLDNLHVVSDYDRTLTKCFHEGKKRSSVISLIRSGGYLTKDYPEKAFALFDKYHPYEMDKDLDLEIKSKYMQEWWTTHRELLMKSGMNKGVIDDILRKYSSLFREKTRELLKELNNFKIPLLILSAGVGNLIEGYLKQENIFYSNIQIISNIFEFDENGNALGYKDKIIHVFNKSEASIPEEYKTQISKRKNVILMGDSLGDLDMTSGMDHDIVIKIGFLNEDLTQLPLYKEKFDVVITNDGDMGYVLDLV